MHMWFLRLPHLLCLMALPSCSPFIPRSIFFVSGLNTLIQTTIGDRLPIVQVSRRTGRVWLCVCVVAARAWHALHGFRGPLSV
jgi:hypothetical protein